MFLAFRVVVNEVKCRNYVLIEMSHCRLRHRDCSIAGSAFIVHISLCSVSPSKIYRSCKWDCSECNLLRSILIFVACANINGFCRTWYLLCDDGCGHISSKVYSRAKSKTVEINSKAIGIALLLSICHIVDLNAHLLKVTYRCAFLPVYQVIK